MVVRIWLPALACARMLSEPYSVVTMAVRTDGVCVSPSGMPSPWLPLSSPVPPVPSCVPSAPGSRLSPV